MTGLEAISLRVAEKGLEYGLHKLLQVQDEQLKRLKSIESKIDTLLVGPYRSGQDHLESALRHVRVADEARVLAELEKARDRFIESFHLLSHDSWAQSQAALSAAGTSL